MKSYYVSDLRKWDPGKFFQSQFRLKGAQIQQTQSGGDFLRLLLADKTGEMEAVWWDGREHHLRQIQETPYAKVSGKTDLYQGKKQIKIQAAPEWLAAPEDASDYERVAALPVDILRARLDAHLFSVQNPHLQALLSAVFHDPSFRSRFDRWPAAKRLHHACQHGLLQHTLEVTDLAAVMCKTQSGWGYPPLSQDMVITGALLHDVGKIYEYSETLDGSFQSSLKGQMFGHIQIATLWINTKISKLPHFPADIRDAVLHMIDAHHGKPEFGSAIPPMFTEAQIVHMADLLDTQMYYFQEAARSATEETVKVWPLENRTVLTRSWENLETIETTQTLAEAPMIHAPHPLMPQLPAKETPLPVFRFHTETRDASSNTTFQTRRLPLVGRAAAGMPQFAEQHIEDHYEVEDQGLPSGVNYLLQVDGNSMTGDGIHNGEMVLVHQQAHQELEDIAVIFFDDRSEAAIKRVKRTEEGGAELLSSNPEYSPILVSDAASLRICGRVVGVLRN